KEDGSLVAFMALPNKKIFAKTIGSFVSEQAQAAYRVLYSNEEHIRWVKDLIDFGYTPLFEYVSWDNRIVLKYSTPELRYIGVRCNTNGDFIPAGSRGFDSLGERIELQYIPEGVTLAKKVNYTLDELIEKSKAEENKEGWVVMFEDGQLIKIKTKWYCDLHGLRTENASREDFIITKYLEGTLDDVISQLDKNYDSDMLSFIDDVCKAIDKFIFYIDNEVYNLVDIFEKNYDKNWDKFATDCHKNKYFSLAKKLIDSTKDVYTYHKHEYIIKRASKLKNAQELVRTWKNK
ncbi:MAG: RNA ligase, partial [Nanoarchaeota archaeon]